MTRETKIGLLVGLAFIIVIGILLSDHLTSSNEPPAATLANAGNNVRQGVNAPVNTNPPITNITPGPVSPRTPVPTTEDLTQRQPPVQIVQIGPGQQQPQGPTVSLNNDPLRASDPQANAQPAQAQPANPQPSNGGAGNREVLGADPPRINPNLADAAARGGEQIVPVGGSSDQGGGNPSNWNAALNGLREHVAQPGDSVSRLASRYLGGNTKANREAIVRANPSLQSNPDRVIIGQTYLIPLSAENPPAANNPAPSRPAAPAPVEREAGYYYYTVKEGDSLWRIATDQLGKPSAVAAIKELNADVLRGSDVVQVGMRLKLPGRPLASNQ